MDHFGDLHLQKRAQSIVEHQILHTTHVLAHGVQKNLMSSACYEVHYILTACNAQYMQQQLVPVLISRRALARRERGEAGGERASETAGTTLLVLVVATSQDPSSTSIGSYQLDLLFEQIYMQYQLHVDLVGSQPTRSGQAGTLLQLLSYKYINT